MEQLAALLLGRLPDPPRPVGTEIVHYRDLSRLETRHEQLLDVGPNYPGGKLVFNVFASLAEFERDIIRERTMAGLEAARVRALAARLMKDGDVPISEVCEAVDVSRATLYRYLNPDRTPRREDG